MKRIKKTFQNLKKSGRGALIPFTVIGYPDYGKSLEVVKTLARSADMLELGLAFSDPIADGPTIQEADRVALQGGINTDLAFRFIAEVRRFTQIPIGLLVYANLIFQRGIGMFYSDAAKAGVDSVLVADLPVEESDEYVKAAEKAGVDTVFIISPLTDEARMKMILEKTTGFAYLVSRLGVTGAKASLHKSALELIRRARKHTVLPICVGFGISRPEHVRSVLAAGADGAIVGSAVVDRIRNDAEMEKYLKELKAAT
ncbi:MAG: tryptophan synthase subunit alpha [archaeon]